MGGMLRRALLLLPLALPARAQADPWAALAEGGVALLRHAIAPGGGDPPGMRLDDCATQRTLSDAGRDQARAIGAAFRARGIAAADVASSAWCRARETAELLALGPVRHERALNSFFGRSATEAERAGMLALVAGWRGPGARVLVTHQVNITLVTGIIPPSGGAVVLRPDGAGGFAQVGRLPPP
jgi:phosphohistidine phosphatase SixA